MSPEGEELFLRLAEMSDVDVENLRAGARPKEKEKALPEEEYRRLAAIGVI